MLFESHFDLTVIGLGKLLFWSEPFEIQASSEKLFVAYWARVKGYLLPIVQTVHIYDKSTTQVLKLERKFQIFDLAFLKVFIFDPLISLVYFISLHNFEFIRVFSICLG